MRFDTNTGTTINDMIDDHDSKDTSLFEVSKTKKVTCSVVRSWTPWKSWNCSSILLFILSIISSTFTVTAQFTATVCARMDYGDQCTKTNLEGCPCPTFSDEERTEILDLHNERRNEFATGNGQCLEKLCPEATNMNKLVWDKGLEVMATYQAHMFRADFKSFFILHYCTLSYFYFTLLYFSHILRCRAKKLRFKGFLGATS